MQTKLVVFVAKDLDRLIGYLKSKGFNINENEHMVLTDNSEVCRFEILKDNKVHGVMVAHYISQYYKVIVETKDKSDNEVLRELLKAKYSLNKWKTPVNPIVVVTNDKELEKHLNNYRDNYPCSDAEKYSRHYREAVQDRFTLFSRILLNMLGLPKEEIRLNTNTNDQKGE